MRSQTFLHLNCILMTFQLRCCSWSQIAWLGEIQWIWFWWRKSRVSASSRPYSGRIWKWLLCPAVNILLITTKTPHLTLSEPQSQWRHEPDPHFCCVITASIPGSEHYLGLTRAPVIWRSEFILMYFRFSPASPIRRC